MITGLSLKGLVFVASATLVLFILLAAFRYFFKTLNKKILGYLDQTDWVLRILRLELLSAEGVKRTVSWTLGLLHTAFILVLLYLYIPLVLRFFPWTQPLAQPFVDYFMNPMAQIWASMVGYTPSLLHILVIIIFTWLILKLLKGLFAAIGAGYIVLPGFYPEWSVPSYRIVQFVILALALVMIFPLMPGADSPAFKSISLFVGAMVTLGSSGAMTNITAGIVLAFTRSFSPGDFVRIAGTFGKVIERTLLVTRLLTDKHENVTIPNSMVLSGQVINYSDTADSVDIIVHASIGLGYDIDWRKVHQLLVGAAIRTRDIEQEPTPFVLQKSLDDFSISYEINAYTRRPEKLPDIYSELNRHILDAFKHERIEILSPRYTAVRDGNSATIPGNSDSQS